MSSVKYNLGDKVVLIKGDKAKYYRDVCAVIDNENTAIYDYIIQTVHGTYKLFCRENQLRLATESEIKGGYRE